MNDAGRQHKRAWEYDAYNFWVEHNGTPEVRAKEDAENPEKKQSPWHCSALM